MKVLIFLFISCFFANFFAKGRPGEVASYDLPVQKVWTQEEMDNAIPMPLLQVNGTPPFSLDDLKMATCNANNTLLNANYQSWYGSRDYLRATGKVFFTLKGSNYVCSASIAAANLVWTAGHCVCEPSATSFNNPTWATSFSFVPGYYNGNGQSYTGRTLRASAVWANGRGQSGMASDYALVQFDNNAFGNLRPLPLSYNIGTPASYNYISRGYPAASPFNGMWVNECNTLGCRRDTSMSPQTVGIACNSNGGSSGGPWYTGENHGICSVNSYGYSNQANVMYGPYFNTDTYNFFRSVVTLSNNQTKIN